MLAGALGEFLASLAWSFLKWHLERQTIRDDERRKIALEGLEQVNLALGWKASHPVIANPDDPFADFLQRNKPDTQLQGNDPPAPDTQRSDKDGAS